MTCTANQARELHARIRAADGNLGAALHQIRVELTAIEPYSNRELSALAEILRWLLVRSPDVQARALAQMQESAL